MASQFRKPSRTASADVRVAVSPPGRWPIALASALVLATVTGLPAQQALPRYGPPPVSVQTAPPIVTPASANPIPPAPRHLEAASPPPMTNETAPRRSPPAAPEYRAFGPIHRVSQPPPPAAPAPRPQPPPSVLQPPPPPPSPAVPRPLPPDPGQPVGQPEPGLPPVGPSETLAPPVQQPEPDPPPVGQFAASDPSPGQATLPGILVRLPIAEPQPGGTVWMQPNVQPMEFPAMGTTGAGPLPVWDPAVQPGGEVWNGELAPLPGAIVDDPCVAYGADGPCVSCGSGHCGADCSQPLFGRALSRLHRRACDPCGPFAPLIEIFSPANCSGDLGVGRERLMFAPFELEPSQPQNNYRIRVDLANNFLYPNRAEYFWAAPGKGPESLDTSVDYQDYRILSELGSGSLSASTEVVLRSLDPVFQANTAGLSDINVGTKLVLFDGKRWQWSQVFRTYFNTGPPRKGLGTGHISMEPGLVGTYRWTPATLLHFDFKYWFPIAGDPAFSGQVLRYGMGYSHLMLETDAFAVIHTGEFLGLCFQNGQRYTGTLLEIPGAGDDPSTFEPVIADVDGEGVFHYYPGLRFVADTGGDCGLFEFGIAGTFGIGRDILFDSLLRFDFRWSY